MSAYGTIAAPNTSAELSVHTWPLANGLILTTYPVYGSNAPRALIDYFHKVFNDELEGKPWTSHEKLEVSLTLRGKDVSPGRR
jgi:hypothetical protein